MSEAQGQKGEMHKDVGHGLVSPHDTPTGAVTRFLMELASWVLGPWAAVDAGLPLPVGLLLAVCLVALPATFNARGDKAKDGVLVPGVVRLGIEAFLGLVVLVAATALWGGPGALVAGLFLAVAGVTGRRRARWLLAGAGDAVV
jgi:hypothetical protein